LPLCLYWTQGIDRVTLVQFNIGPIDIYPVTQDWQIPSRILMSLSMLRGVLINCLYGHPVTDNVGSVIKHSTLHLGSIVVSGRRVVYTIITMRITYDTLHNFLYSILIAGQSGINITHNIHTFFLDFITIYPWSMWCDHQSTNIIVLML
jgi:hypothetical protein